MKKIPQAIADQLVLPVIAAPMFLVSSPEMVVESCKAGIIGSFPLLNARTPEVLDQWMTRIRENLAQARAEEPGRRVSPWAVNLIVHRTNRRYEADVEMIKRHQPPIVITSLGNPQPVVQIAHRYGGLVFSDVSTLTHARKAALAGVDGLILVCCGAGGHAGTLHPMAFLGAVKQFWEGMTILSGCISSGSDILAAQVMGAAFAYMGTRFIATEESFASEAYRQMVVESSLEDIVYTDAFSGVHANFLKPSIIQAGLDPDNLRKKETVDFSELDQTRAEAKAWKDIWGAGQGVGATRRIVSVSELVAELKQEYDRARDAVCGNRLEPGI